MKKNSIITMLCVTIFSVASSVPAYAYVDFPFTVEDGVTKFNEIFQELHEDGKISELYVVPTEPATVDDENHRYLFAARNDSDGILIITFDENVETTNVTSFLLSGGWDASDEFMNELYPAGVLLADQNLSYDDASDIVSQILEEGSGRYDSGNLEYELEDGYQLSFYLLNEPTDNPNTDTSIKENVTMGETQALEKAKKYLSISAFSYKGLVDQLVYDKFSDKEAKYAADNCGADWYEQAEIKAKAYLEISSFSADGLREQLEYDGFTFTQAYMAVLSLGYTF